ncbi:hypothetical protein CVT24_007767 [Panaeolus cyanescens]|uniref:NmrA-like domain-containing protein n=1 Tax=Panaeolus cyanescens TaxID=181874 RepID=A0A409YKQ7_9AGAR|nr:hypothetical protein CVT24_007767 [Panaeolus cyanescens]
MTTLIIGGTGNTGFPLAQMLHAAGRATLLTNRSGKVPEPFKGIAFDWSDASTFENPFKADSNIDSVYIIPPFDSDSLKVAKPFLDLAISNNVKKFVLLGAIMTTLGGDGPFSDSIYKYIVDSGVDFVVLRPTWFMENFKRNFLKTIKEENYIFSCTGDGKSPFVSTDDVAKAAFEALTTDKYSRQAPYVFGPHLLSYSEVAEVLSQVLGRKIEHRLLPVQVMRNIYASVLPDVYADALVDGELSLAAGKEEELFNHPAAKITTTFLNIIIMTTLIIGGTGNTGLALAKLLYGAGLDVLLTSRSGKAPEPFKAVSFDWTRPSTFEEPFRVDPSIDQVYFIPPSSADSLKIVKPFLDIAISKNVKKFVLLATAVTTAGGAAFAGDIYQYFLESTLDWVVLRPTWFMQNFSLEYLETIKNDNYFFTASSGGKTIPIHTDDIAQAAYDALVSNKFSREAPYIFGPQPLTTTEVAEIFSSVLGRTIVHKQVTAEERTNLFLSFGLPEADAKALVDAELGMAEGAEENVFNDPKEVKYVGKTTLREFVEANAALWQKVDLNINVSSISHNFSSAASDSEWESCILLSAFEFAYNGIGIISVLQNHHSVHLKAMAILIIGGTGATGQPLAKLLHSAGHSVIITSRSGKAVEPYKSVAFDWFDPSTFENPFNIDPSSSIDKIYLVSPPVVNPGPMTKPFIDLAISKGVKKFVLLSATVAYPESLLTGKIHEYLIETGVDYVALRPTWFMQNFVRQFGHTIKEHDHVYSVAGDGQIPFVSVDDIARAAFEALTTENISRADIFVVGPELFTYDQASLLLSGLLGRRIVHKRITREEHKDIFGAFGVPPDYAYVLSGAEEGIRNGTEVDAFNAPPERKRVGKTTLKEFFVANIHVWQ